MYKNDKMWIKMYEKVIINVPMLLKFVGWEIYYLILN